MSSFVFLAHMVLVGPLLSFLGFRAFWLLWNLWDLCNFEHLGLVGFVLLRSFLQCVH